MDPPKPHKPLELGYETQDELDVTWRRLRSVSSLGRVSQTDDSFVGRLKGYLALLMLIISWVGGAEITQSLQKSQSFNKPYLITWTNHVISFVQIPIQILVMACRRQGVQFVPSELTKVSARELFTSNLFMAVVYLFADYVWYLALPHVTVSEGTAIFNTGPVFVYMLSVAVMGEAVSIRKVVAVLCAIGGVCVLSYLGSSSDGETKWWAALLVVFSAFLYGVYEVYFKIKVTNTWRADSVMSVNWVVGVTGLITAVILWPGMILVHYLPSSWSGVHEPFALPESGQWVGFWAGAMGALAFNIFIGIALSFLPPVVVSVGCVLTIPVSAVSDKVFHDKVFNGWHALGGFLIIASFLLLSDEVVAAVTKRWGRSNQNQNNFAEDIELVRTPPSPALTCHSV